MSAPSAAERRQLLALILVTLAVGILLSLLRPPSLPLAEAVPPGKAIISARLDTLGRLSGTPVAETGPVSPSKVKLNSSPREWLTECPGIGPAMADHLIRERRQSYFSSWEDLLARVPGMGPARIVKLREAGVMLGP